MAGVPLQLRHHRSCHLPKVQPPRVLRRDDEAVDGAAWAAAVLFTRERPADVADEVLAGLAAHGLIAVEEPALRRGSVAVGDITQQPTNAAFPLWRRRVVAVLDVTKEAAHDAAG